MLFRQKLCRRHDRSLYATGNGLETCDCRDNRLTRTNVALNQAHHWMWLRKVAHDFIDDSLLCPGELKRQLANDTIHPRCAVNERRRRFGFRKGAQIFETKVVRE